MGTPGGVARAGGGGWKQAAVGGRTRTKLADVTVSSSAALVVPVESSRRLQLHAVAKPAGQNVRVLRVEELC